MIIIVVIEYIILLLLCVGALVRDLGLSVGGHGYSSSHRTPTEVLEVSITLYFL